MRLILGLLLCVGLAAGAVWEFGNGNIGSITWRDSGTIHIYEKHKAVHVQVQPCQKLVYVRVDVDNLISTPEVNFDSISNTVNIVYKLWQKSYSTYNIYAKTLPIAGCAT